MKRDAADHVVSFEEENFPDAGWAHRVPPVGEGWFGHETTDDLAPRRVDEDHLREADHSGVLPVTVGRNVAQFHGERATVSQGKLDDEIRISEAKD